MVRRNQTMSALTSFDYGPRNFEVLLHQNLHIPSQDAQKSQAGAGAGAGKLHVLSSYKKN
jgi:hypothetical protein